MNNRNLLVKILHRRERRRREAQGPAFESSSMADMAFLLLIFFIVTGSFVLRQGIFFSLPSKTAGAVQLNERQIVEVYPQNNGFRYESVVLDRDGFKKILIARSDATKDSVLVIYMGKSVRYERLVDTLSVARESGMNRVSLKNADRG
ncbi:MAG: biopolymer transporter ExbD [Spirochaetes bacterium]|jgi:biopolymer transport protein ExbD|nr:biopolymer transporter ExbD [Spirochaetota bacterium]